MIYIIGAGAIGKALAVMLANAGKQVQLVRGSIDKEADSIEKINVRLPDCSLLTAEVTVKTLSSFSQIDGTILITSKSYGNENIAGKLTRARPTGPIVLLQNGLNIEQPFLDSGLHSIYRCVLMATSQFNTDGTIQFKPVAQSPVGIIRGSVEVLEKLITDIDNPWFPFRQEALILAVVWKKVIANCVFNSVCPLLDIDNGVFHRDKSALGLARIIIAECVQVASRAGVLLDSEEVEQLVLNISRSSDRQLISTLQDIKNGRQTEINTLNLAVARQAEVMQIVHLATVTRLLGVMTQLKSQLSQ